MDERSEIRGRNRPCLVLGLGNPGAEYRDTRHNLGFAVGSELARRRKWKLGEAVCNSIVGGEGGPRVALPQTFMNRSGYAARCLLEKFGIEPVDLLVVYDDIDLPLGTIRLRSKGGPSGHRGMESIIESLRTDEIPRLRLGVAGDRMRPQGDDLVDYVLSEFEESELPEVREIVERAVDLAEEWIGKSETESVTVQLGAE